MTETLSEVMRPFSVIVSLIDFVCSVKGNETTLGTAALCGLVELLVYAAHRFWEFLLEKRIKKVIYLSSLKIL